MAHRLLQIGTGILLGLAVVALVFLFAPPRPGLDTAEGHPAPYTAPGFALPDLEGRTVTLESFPGQTRLVFFGFASCPDVCPITLLNWTRALSILEEEGRNRRFQGIFISVDPNRDTPEVLERYMGNFHPSIVALTGTRELLDATAWEWGVHVQVHEPDPHAGHGADTPDPHAGHGSLPAGVEVPTPLPGTPAPPDADELWYGVDHSARTFVVDRRGRVVRTIAAFSTAEEIVEALRPHLR